MRTNTRRRLLGMVCTLTFLAALAVPLGGCNTVKGLGRDVESVAQGGQDIIDGKTR